MTFYGTFMVLHLNYNKMNEKDEMILLGVHCETFFFSRTLINNFSQTKVQRITI